MCYKIAEKVHFIPMKFASKTHYPPKIKSMAFHYPKNLLKNGIIIFNIKNRQKKRSYFSYITLS